MKILVTGAGGQVGRALLASAVDEIELVGVARGELDICRTSAVHEMLATHEPDWVINAAAYTAVDKAEEDEENAFAVNGSGVRELAEACHSQGCRLLHLSTDFVFDGAATTPYAADAVTAPLGVYGQSKLAGEVAAMEILSDAIVLRTAWVYAAEGGNFVNTMLRLMREKDELRVVADQQGSPTWATSVARACVEIVSRRPGGGVLHWTDKGVTSWHGFAVAIQEYALELGLLEKSIPIHAIESHEYPTPAKRPAYSALDCTATEELLGRRATPWRENLQAMLKEKLNA